MPIPVSCECGRSLKVKDEFAGRKIRCSQCEEVLLVPQVEAEEELLEVVPVAAEEEQSRRSAIQTKPSRSTRRERDEDLTDEPPPPRKKRRPLDYDRPRRPLPEPGSGGGFGTTRAGVFGGLLMMLIAVVWFVGGLFGGIIFFYPPVLFIVGLIAFAKGLAGD